MQKKIKKSFESFLISNKVTSYSKLWIINTICINKGTLELVKKINKRSDVVEIVFDEKI